MRLVWGVIDAVTTDRPELQRVVVHLDDGSAPGPAVVYPQLTGRCVAGDRVLCNTTAVDLGLGTGGDHFVVARAGDGIAVDEPVDGHIMRLRYTPLQHTVTVAEEPASPAHAVMAEARSLDGMPVVCCGLHSQVGIVAAAIKHVAPWIRVAYVMTDEAALPLAVSRLVTALLSVGLLDETVTCGQAFGGGVEAVNRHSALLAARHVTGADVAIISLGPGIVGTATPYGHGGVAQGEAINASAALGGTPIAVLRVSFADPRPRHVPVSHQTLTALTGVALARAIVAVPPLEARQRALVDEALAAAGVWEVHERRSVPEVVLPGFRGVDVKTMGRGPEDDPAFFAAAAAAGRVAADEVLARRSNAPE